MSLEMQTLLRTFAHPGSVKWLGLRPARRTQMQIVESVFADVEQGLVGDRFAGPPQSKRQISLIQYEHLSAVGQLLKRPQPIDPQLLRRNIVVAGINLQALKNCQFQIGDAVLFATGNCAPCSRMEEALGTGGYNAMRGHGGITAYVQTSGKITLGDRVSLVASSPA